jgi:hypothetical protein
MLTERRFNMLRMGLAVMVIAALFAGTALGTPTVMYTLTLNGVYTDNTNKTPVALTQAQLASAPSLPAAYDYDLQLSMSIGGLAAGENLEAVQVVFQGLNDGTLTSGPVKWGYWGHANPPLVEIGSRYYNYFVMNQSINTSGGQYVYVGINDNVANAVTPGQSGPVVLGDLWVNWDGVTPVDVTPAALSSPNALETWVNNASGTSNTSKAYDSDGFTVVSSGVQFGAAPEPATLSLLALGGLAMLRRRK